MSDQETQLSSGEERSPKPNRDERHERSSGGGGGQRDRGRRRHQPQPPRRPEATLNMEELRELVELIAQYGFTDFELEREGIRVRLRRELAPQIIAAPQQQQFSAHAPSTPATPASDPAHAATKPDASAEAERTRSATSTQAEAADAEEEESLVIIPSPIVGTFYRSPSPNSEPFVRLGSHVDPDTVVCIIEAMKLMNEIDSEYDGEITSIYIENGQAVQYGERLFAIKTS